MRGPFARFRQERADDRELGTGLWRRAHDRLSRALDRYWQVLEGQRGTDVLSPEAVSYTHLTLPTIYSV